MLVSGRVSISKIFIFQLSLVEKDGRDAKNAMAFPPLLPYSRCLLQGIGATKQNTTGWGSTPQPIAHLLVL